MKAVVSGVVITGVGKYLPSKTVLNSELSGRLGVDDEWIESRTGIRERRMAAPSESTSTLAAAAGREALAAASVRAEDLDLVVVATCTGDHLFPSTASLVQHAIGATGAAAFDLNAACSGFVYGLAMAAGMLAAGSVRKVLLIGSEVLTRFLNEGDPVTAPIFGDGAGAVVLEAAHGDSIALELGSDGSGAERVIIPAGGSRIPASADTVDRGQHYIRMAGREVFRSAVLRMSDLGRQLGEFDLVIGHQANKRILDECARELGIDADRMFMNIDRYGNTSAASIPIALCEAWETGRLRTGDRVLFLAFGAGFSWGGVNITWTMDGAPNSETGTNVMAEVAR